MRGVGRGGRERGSRVWGSREREKGEGDGQDRYSER